MSYSLPTLPQLLDRTRKAFRTYLPGSDAFIWPNNIYVSAKVIAGAVFEVFGYASYIARMIHVHTAPDIETLRRHGTDYGMGQRPAEPASGVLTITSSNDLSVDAGAVFARTDGVQYVALAAASKLGAGTLDVPATSIVDGALNNAEIGTPLDMVSGVTDAAGDAAAEVSSAFVGGADVEDMESFRERIWFRKKNPPHGGAPADYVMWAGESSGVTRTFVERRWAGTGTVRVFVLMDNLFANGIPDADAVARVRDHIDTVAPATALVTVAAPSAFPVDVTVKGLSPDTSTVREAVLAELRGTFRRLARASGSNEPRPGMPYLATPEIFSRSWLWQAVANAAGEQRHEIAVPAADVVIPSGGIAVLGNVSFVA